MRDGVGASRVAVTAGPETRVVDFLATRLPRVTDWPARLARAGVRDAQGRAVDPQARCRRGELLWYWRELPPEPRVPFEIEVLHQDAWLVAVDKPHFLAVLPRGRHLQETVLVRLRRLLGLDTLAPMHRLDRETAGVMLFTVQPATRAAYQGLLRERRVHKVYEAVAPWRDELGLPRTVRHRLQERPGDRFMQMEAVEGEPNAETLVEPVRCFGDRALYRLTPSTGRKHQLRAQMSALGIPIEGDRLYPVLEPEPDPAQPPDWSQPLQLLARELSFTDPVTGQHRRFTSRRRLDALPP